MSGRCRRLNRALHLTLVKDNIYGLKLDAMPASLGRYWSASPGMQAFRSGVAMVVRLSSSGVYLTYFVSNRATYSSVLAHPLRLNLIGTLSF